MAINTDFQGIRQRVEKIAGVADDTDDIINEAVRHLDLKFETPHSIRWFIEDITSGDFTKTFSDCRYILEVWIANTDGTTRLPLKDLTWLRQTYPKMGSSDTATPAFYSILPDGLAPEQFALTSSSFSGKFDYSDMSFGDNFAERAIIFMPPTDATFTMRIKGSWFNQKLTADTDTNFWTVVYPETLVKSTMNILETRQRNIEGA